jgi:hypothetical protein
VASRIEARSVEFLEKSLDEEALERHQSKLKLYEDENGNRVPYIAHRSDFMVYRVTRFDDTFNLPRLIRVAKELNLDAARAQLLLTSFTSGNVLTGIIGGFAGRVLAEALDMHFLPTMHHTVLTMELVEAGKVSSPIDWIKVVVGSYGLEMSYKSRWIHPIVLLRRYEEKFKEMGLDVRRNVHGGFGTLAGLDDQTRDPGEKDRFDPDQIHG